MLFKNFLKPGHSVFSSVSSHCCCCWKISSSNERHLFRLELLVSSSILVYYGQFVISRVDTKGDGSLSVGDAGNECNQLELVLMRFGVYCTDMPQSKRPWQSKLNKNMAWTKSLAWKLKELSRDLLHEKWIGITLLTKSTILDHSAASIG